jgi:hypothetical protein
MAARSCISIANTCSQKAKLLAMAQSWMISLTDLAARNSHFVRIDETPPRRESHIHSARIRRMTHEYVEGQVRFSYDDQ